MDIKPIETFYNGYHFRSRLEARWAVFFDAIGQKYEYEPQGYTLSDGTKYLPDFYLREVQGRGGRLTESGVINDIFIEIKGTLTDRDLQKIQQFSIKYPIIIFGQIPDCRYSLWTDHKWYYDFDFSKDNNENFYNLSFSEGDFYWTEPKAAKSGGLILDYPDNPYDDVDNAKTFDAYTKAKQARFEHGEMPIIRRW